MTHLATQINSLDQNIRDMIKPQTQLKAKVEFLEARLKEQKQVTFDDDSELSRAMFTLK